MASLIDGLKAAADQSAVFPDEQGKFFFQTPRRADIVCVHAGEIASLGRGSGPRENGYGDLSEPERPEVLPVLGGRDGH